MNDSSYRATGLLASLPGPLGVIAAVFVVLGVWGGPRNSTVPAVDSSKRLENRDATSSEEIVETPSSGTPRALVVLQKFFGYRSTVQSTRGDAKSQQAAGIPEDLDTDLSTLEKIGSSTRHIDGLVATIPHPVDSHFQITFDRYLDAMARAVETQGYVLDSYSLPWSNVLPVQGGRVSGTERVSGRYGCVLFRRYSQGAAGGDERRNPIDVNDLLLLLLVGETPTAGIDRIAFSEAMDVAARLQISQAHSAASTDGGPPLQLRILAPTYSGTTPSLRMGLTRWWSDFPKDVAKGRACIVRVLSGGATADKNFERLNFVEPKTKLAVTFQATVIPDRFAFWEMLKYLEQERDIPLERIAILKEGNTTYGQQLAKGDQAGENVSSSGRAHSEESASEDFRQLRTIPFPVGLSRVRSEYDKMNSGKRSDQEKSATAIAQRRNLQLSLDQPSSATDLLPTFSDATTAANDVVLEHIMTTISRDDIRAVGLMGTDVRDKLFLAQYIRRFAPDVLLFTLESDVLFTHAQFASSLKGTLFATTYPLAPRSREWTTGDIDDKDPRDPDLFFQTTTSEGVFNATLLLLSVTSPKPVGLLDYSMPLAPIPGAETASKPHPALWITILGESAMLPLKVVPFDNPELPLKADTATWQVQEDAQPQQKAALVTPDGNGHSVEAKPAVAPPTLEVGKRRYTIEYSPSPVTNVSYVVVAPSLVPFTLINSACLIVATLFLAINFPFRWLRRNASGKWLGGEWLFRAVPWLRTDAGGLVSTTCSRNRSVGSNSLACLKSLTATGSRRFAAVLFLALLGLQMTVSSPVIAWWSVAVTPLVQSVSGGWEAVFHCLAALLFAAAYGLIFLCLIVCTAPRWRTLQFLRGLRWPWLFILFGAFVAVIVFGLVVCLIAWVCSPLTIVIFIDRASGWSNGANALVPLVALFSAFLLWAVCHMRWRYLLHAFPIPTRSRDLESENEIMRGVVMRMRDLDARLMQFCAWPTELGDWTLIVLVIFGCTYAFGFQWTCSAEGWWWDVAVRGLACLALAMFLVLFIRLAAVCGLFERLLRRLGQHPMSAAFSHVPERPAAKVSGQIYSAAPHPGDLDQPIRCLHQLVESCDPDWKATMDRVWPDRKRETERIEAEFGRLDACERHGLRKLHRHMDRISRRLFRVAHDNVVPLLSKHWANKSVMRRDVSKTTTDKSSAETSPVPWENEAEVFVAMQYVHVIRLLFSHIQNMMTFLVAMLLCLLVCFDAYPFQPRQLLLTMCFALVLWTVIRTVVVIVKFNRDEVLSRLGDTPLNRFSFDRSVFMPLLTYVIIPLAGIVLIRFPSLSTFFSGWLDSLTRVGKL
jgi:hypothetical protein